MMNVKEYARDVEKEIKVILDMCKKLNINCNNEDDLLGYHSFR